VVTSTGEVIVSTGLPVSAVLVGSCVVTKAVGSCGNEITTVVGACCSGVEISGFSVAIDVSRVAVATTEETATSGVVTTDGSVAEVVSTVADARDPRLESEGGNSASVSTVARSPKELASCEL
jgi:hypothetical protein